MTLEPLVAEAYRLHLMRGVEGDLSLAGFERVAGVDEAGRGALAGPVVVAAVLMDAAVVVPGVDDSKALRPSVRAALAEAIKAAAVDYRIVSSSATEIDRSNILVATKRAMYQALTELSPRPDCALVDAVSLPGLPFPALPLVRGDMISYSIACASILAKVERDRRMVEWHQDYPHYGFDQHKGYGAPRHRQSLRFHGPSPIHRLTFGSVVPRSTEGTA